MTVDATMEAARVRALLTPLWARPDVELVVLFGSRATGTARPSSDTDLGVLVSGDVGPVEREVMRLLGTGAIDVVDLKRAPPLLAFEIARHGVLLHERTTSAFASFVSLALRRYNDTRKLRDARRQNIRNFLREEGL